MQRGGPTGAAVVVVATVVVVVAVVVAGVLVVVAVVEAAGVVEATELVLEDPPHEARATAASTARHALQARIAH